MTGPRIAYSVALPEDFADIQALLAETDMPGWITLSYRSDLNRARCMAPGGSVRSVIGRAPDGRLAGMASRMVMPGYWQGQPMKVGWVAQLRLSKASRHRPAVLRGGFDAFRRELHDAKETPWYMGSILSENRTAKRLLERGLPGFPEFVPLMGYRILAFRASRSAQTDMVRAATAEDAPALRAFLNRENRTRPLAPAFEPDEDFRPGRWPGLEIGNFLLALRDGEICGATAIWSHYPFRRLVVAGYDPRLATVRRLANLLAPLTGLPSLPRLGAALPMAYLAFFTVAGNEPAIARALVAAAGGAARLRGLSIVALGLVEDDPLLPPLSALRHRGYDATLYGVTWLPGEKSPPKAQFRLAKVEAALL